VTQPSLFTGTLVCAVEGCGRPVLVQKNGLCRNHYMLQRRANMPTCSVEGCERPQQSKGYCMTHYQRSLYGKSLDVPITHRSELRKCAAEGCDETPHKRSVFCKEHKSPRKPSLIRDERGRKQCSRCKKWKQESEFITTSHNRSTADGLMGSCRECKADYSRQRKHGIGTRGRDRLLRQQGGVCAICGTDDPGSANGWCIDHDHSCCSGTNGCGKCVRGVLCHGCNVALGFFADDPDRMSEAIAYLRRHRRVRLMA